MTIKYFNSLINVKNTKELYNKCINLANKEEVINEEETPKIDLKIEFPKLPEDFNFNIKHEEPKSINIEEKFRPIHFNKYPGNIHMQISHLYNHFPSSNINDFLSLKIEYKNNFTKDNKKVQHATSLIRESKCNNFSYYFKIPIEFINNESLKLKITILRHRNGKESIFGQAGIRINRTVIDTIRNNLIEIKTDVIRKNHNFMDYVLCGPNRMSKNMTIFCSYLSNEEVPTINVPNPNNLFSLGKWLKARKYAYSKLFSGHLNVKGDLNDYDIIKWKKSYVRIFGYTIYLFNYKSKKSTGIININEAKPTISETNTISLNLVNYERILELHTDSKEDFQKLKTAIEILFPKEKL